MSQEVRATGIDGYSHVSLTVTDLERSVAWYREVLGFTVHGHGEREGFRRARLAGPGGGPTLSLTQHAGGTGDPFSETRTGLDHLAFTVPHVTDVEALGRRFDELGVEHSGIRRTGPVAAITFRDPDNVQLEVFSSGA